MGYPNRGNRSGSGRGFGGGGRSFGGDRNFSRPPMEMHKTTCSNCGNECEVPFRPTGDRPVYCKDCFAKMGGGREARPNFERRDDRKMAPRESFNPGPPPPPPPHDNKKLDEINSKLDRLISLLTPTRPTPAPINEAVEVEEEAPKKIAKPRKAKKIVPPVETEIPQESPTEEIATE